MGLPIGHYCLMPTVQTHTTMNLLPTWKTLLQMEQVPLSKEGRRRLSQGHFKFPSPQDSTFAHGACCEVSSTISCSDSLLCVGDHWEA